MLNNVRPLQLDNVRGSENKAENFTEHPAVQEVLRSGSWGCFAITPKQPSAKSRFGGFQLACPFHRLNSKTDCKRFLSAEGPTRKHKMECLRKLIWWASIAKQCSRQRIHMTQPLELASGVDFDLLQLHVITEKPSRADVFDDEQLHNLEVPVELLPPESWTRARELVQHQKNKQENKIRNNNNKQKQNAPTTKVNMQTTKENKQAQQRTRPRRLRGKQNAGDVAPPPGAAAAGAPRGRARRGQAAGAPPSGSSQPEPPEPPPEEEAAPGSDGGSSSSDSDSDSSSSSSSSS